MSAQCLDGRTILAPHPADALPTMEHGIKDTSGEAHPSTHSEPTTTYNQPLDNTNISTNPPPPQSSGTYNAAAQWPAARKWRVISAGCLVTFTAGINGTAILSGADEISNDFGLDTTRFDHSFFLVTAWNMGAAVAPMLIMPMMEDFGYLPIYYTLYALFLVFVGVQAAAPNFATLIVARIIAGCCAGVLQNCPDGINADAWTDDIHRRAVAIDCLIFCLLGGVTVGPAIGGAVVRVLGWRWILYVQLMISGVVLGYVVAFMREPRPRIKPSERKAEQKTFLSSLNETSVRAVRLLFTEFVIGTFTLLSSFAFGTVLVMTQSVPQVFRTLYGWPTWLTGVAQLAMFIGEILGLGLCIFQDTIIYPRFAYRGGRLSVPIPEVRLYTVIPCCFLAFTAGFLVYGWTAYSEFSWALPAFGMLLIGIGIMAVIGAVSTYVTDCYVTFANSAISGVAFGENVFASFLPLATRSMYTNLGFQWASTLLGFIALTLSMAPIVITLYGDRIRAKSRFAD